MDWLKKFINKEKEKIKKDKEYKRKEKELLKKEEAFEKEIDDEIKAQRKKEKEEAKKDKTKWSIKLYLKAEKEWKFLTDTSDEKELESYMSDEEKENFRKQKKENKRFTIIVVTIFAFIFVGMCVALGFFREATKTELEKTTIPLIKEYYNQKYNKKDKLEDTYYLTYKDEDNKDVETEVALATYSSGIHVMTVKNEEIGDDGSNEQVYTDYRSFLINSLPGISFYTNDATISYTPYLVKYNMYYDYIDVLPNGKTFNDLYTSQSLTITDKITYEGELDLGYIQNILNNLGDNSIYYLFQMENGNIVKFSIVTKTNINSYNITSNKNILDDVTYYELDQTYNKVGKVNGTKIADQLVASDELKYTNIRLFEPEDSRNGFREDTRTEYYLVRMNNIKITDNLVFLDESNYAALEVDDYPKAVYFKTSNGAIIVASDEIAIGTEEEYISSNLFCRIGLC